jgi:hypothetical protein
MAKEHLGDGVYVEVEYGIVWLSTDHGFGIISRIALLPEVYQKLLDYVDRLNEKRDSLGQ